MRLILFSMVVVLIPPLANGDDTKDKPKKQQTAEEQFQALIGEFGKARGELSERKREAKTAQERDQLKKDTEKMQEEFSNRFLQFAQKYPKEEFSAQLLGAVVGALGTPTQAAKALDLFVEHHGSSLSDLVEQLGQKPDLETKLRSILTTASSAKGKAATTLALAKVLGNKSEAPGMQGEESAKLSREAEELYEKVITKPVLDREMLESAKSDLWVLRNLAVGKKAPEITGKDADGKEFKLSDYQGKVVVLDFWANW